MFIKIDGYWSDSGKPVLGFDARPSGWQGQRLPLYVLNEQDGVVELLGDSEGVYNQAVAQQRARQQEQQQPVYAFVSQSGMGRARYTDLALAVIDQMASEDPNRPLVQIVGVDGAEARSLDPQERERVEMVRSLIGGLVNKLKGTA